MNGRRRRIRSRNFAAALTVLLTTLAVSTLPFPSVPGAQAATEIQWFVAVPGMTRTDLVATRTEYNPVSGVLYATTAGNTGPKLLAIDTDDGYAILSEVDLDNAPVELLASADGSSVWVATQTSITRHDASTLTVEHSSTPGLETGDVLAVAPSDSNRHALSRADGTVQLFDGDDSTAGSDAALADATLLTFGTTANIIYAVNALGGVRRLDIDAGFAVTAAISDEPVYNYGRLSGFVANEFAALAISESGRFWVEFDPETFEYRRFVNPSQIGLEDNTFGAETIDLVGSVMSARRGPTTVQVDLAAVDLEPRRWTLPIAGRFEFDTSRADGQLAGIEYSGLGGDAPGEKRLTIISPRLFTSGFGEFHALTPTRVLDTREAIGVPAARPLGPDTVITVDIAGAGTVPAEGVLAVALNATVTSPTAPSFISIFPSGSDRPSVSSVNFGPGQTLANFVTVLVDENGRVDLFNRFGSVDVIFDVVGYYSDIDGEQGARYQAADPSRLLDTRERGRPVGAGETVDVLVPRFVEATDPDLPPPRQVAAVLNVTAVNPTDASFLTVYPNDDRRPTASTVNFGPGAVRANLVIARLTPQGTTTIFNRAGSVDVVVDLVGVYIVDDQRIDQQGRLYPLSPFRAFDTRESSPFDAPGSIPADGVLIYGDSPGWTDIINITAAETTSDGYISVIGWHEGKVLRERPATSTVNFRAGEVVANATYASGTPSSGLFNRFGSTHIIVDYFGYLTPEFIRRLDEVWPK